MKLEDIGFYTLSNERAQQANVSSPLWRCELILTGRCNFKCPYCRSIGGEDLPMAQAIRTIKLWAKEGLKNIRFSGGEPTMYKGIFDLVSLSYALGVERIAISTNGSAPISKYKELIRRGVTDFSISLDACCAEDGDLMSGGRKGAFKRVVNAIEILSKLTYVTVGVVLTHDNKESAEEIIKFADGLGVSDIRVIPAAQEGKELPLLEIPQEILRKYPILRYRINNIKYGESVRGLPCDSPSKCGLVLDDMAVMGEHHYPCIIYMRESGNPIGKVSPDMRKEREHWYHHHNIHEDIICRNNCLDVCVDYNFEHFLSSPR